MHNIIDHHSNHCYRRLKLRRGTCRGTPEHPPILRIPLICTRAPPGPIAQLQLHTFAIYAAVGGTGFTLVAAAWRGTTGQRRFPRWLHERPATVAATGIRSPRRRNFSAISWAIFRLMPREATAVPQTTYTMRGLARNTRYSETMSERTETVSRSGSPIACPVQNH